MARLLSFIMISWHVYLACFLLLFAGGCRDRHRHIGQKEVVNTIEELSLTTQAVIEHSLEDAVENNGHLPGFDLFEPEAVQSFYKSRSFNNFWTTGESWNPKADSLYTLIGNARLYGLFPEDYYSDRLQALHRKTAIDTAIENRMDAALWAETEILLTSGFFKLVNDLKAGRLIPDSIRKRDTLLSHNYFHKQLDSFLLKSTSEFTAALEPSHAGYHELKRAIKSFVAGAEFRKYSTIDPADKEGFEMSLRKRFLEDSILFPSDTLSLEDAVKRYQAKHKLEVDGKVGPIMIAHLNNTDHEKFIRVAIAVDRYKQMAPFPVNYVYVNIPSYRLKVFERDSVVLESRVVVGKPITRTPELTSALSDMITYPLWTIPNSIIVKEILPQLKKDPGYLARKGYSLQDFNRNMVDPYTVDWQKYTKGIPFLVIQGSGDDNALGVLKFNFPNKYAVYLHDTNQRYLFAQSKRALSHGCVRVQEWKKLADYLLVRDSANAGRTPIDSLNTWLALKEKHVIPLRNRLPLFIRYMGCEGENGKLLVHEDIYGEDRLLRKAFFYNK